MATEKNSQHAKSVQHAKTPYEIRLEVLQMAKDHLDATIKMQTEFAARMFESLKVANKATVEELAKYAPQMYSVDDITKKAQELYSFIQKKD